MVKYVIFSLFFVCVMVRGWTFWKGTTGPVAFLSSGGAFIFGIASCISLDEVTK